jgi:hypothetical protein
MDLIIRSLDKRTRIDIDENNIKKEKTARIENVCGIFRLNPIIIIPPIRRL